MDGCAGMNLLRKFPSWLVHPLLFSIYPILSYFSNNIDDLRAVDALPSLIIALALAVVLIIAFTLLLGGDVRSAALLATLTLVIFFSYGHLRSLIKQVNLSVVSIGRHRYLLPGAFTLIVLGYWLVRSRIKDVTQVTAWINWVAVVAVIFPLINIGRSAYEVARNKRLPTTERISATASSLRSERGQPDVYYIVLDGYARADILEEIFTLDNQDFIDDLEKRGFQVANRSNSNYNRTVFSIASSLNMAYLQDLTAQSQTSLGQAKILLKDAAVPEYFKSLGYEIVALESGYGPTHINNYDHFIAFEKPHSLHVFGIPFQMGDFEWYLVQTSIVSAIYDGLLAGDYLRVGDQRFAGHRYRVSESFDTLEEIPGWKGSFFVFAHIVSPHPPFVFDSQGNPVDPDYPFTFKDANDYLRYSDRDDYIQGYRDQLIYLNSLVLETVDGIIASSSPAPIIILQADHGSGAYTDFDDVENTDLQERYAIFNAYYFQGETSSKIYPSVTPVNTFRIVFDEFFNGEFELLPDEFYYYDRDDTYIIPIPKQMLNSR
jgi:hypothetical protein